MNVHIELSKKISMLSEEEFEEVMRYITNTQKYNMYLFLMLCCSYAYYAMDYNLLTDTEYDLLTKEVYINREHITLFKELIDFESLENCSSLSYILDYPSSVIEYTTRYLNKLRLEGNENV